MSREKQEKVLDILEKKVNKQTHGWEHERCRKYERKVKVFALGLLLQCSIESKPRLTIGKNLKSGAARNFKRHFVCTPHSIVILKYVIPLTIDQKLCGLLSAKNCSQKLKKALDVLKEFCHLHRLHLLISSFFKLWDDLKLRGEKHRIKMN